MQAGCGTFAYHAPDPGLSQQHRRLFITRSVGDTNLVGPASESMHCLAISGPSNPVVLNLSRIGTFENQMTLSTENTDTSITIHNSSKVRVIK